MIRSIQRFAAVLGMMLLLTAAFGQSPASNSPIDAQLRQRDERLNAPVSLSVDRIYLGELLEALSAKTGVTLSMDNTDRFSGVLIACDLKQVPLSDVMTSLASLVGSKNGVWEWIADTGQTPVRYSLRPTQAARMEAGRRKQARQDLFEKLADLTVRMNSMSPLERKANQGKITSAMQTDAPEMANTRLVSLPANGNFWNGIRLFADLLTPEERLRVLRGGKAIGRTFDTMSEKDRKAALTLEPAEGFKNGTHLEKITSIRFQREPFPSFSPFLPDSDGDPGLLISLGAESSFGGRTYFTIRTSELLPGIAADWALPGDRKALYADQDPIRKGVPFELDTLWKTAPVLDHNIAQMAATEGVSFMAVVPDGDFSALSGVWVQTPVQTPMQNFDEAWRDSRNLMHKWREGILLVSYPKWFYGDESQVPYKTVERLRTSLRKQNGLLSLEDLVDPVAALSPAQRISLRREFAPLQLNGTMNEICAFYTRYPQALTDPQTPVDPVMEIFLRENGLLPNDLEPEEHVVTVYLADLGDRGGPGAYHNYTLQFTTSKPRSLNGPGVRIKRIEPNPLP
jgi:hypothetical protein